MHFDAMTLACVAHELRNSICPSRIQQALLPDEHSIGLEVYAAGQRRYLFISAQPQASRVTLLAEKLRRGVEKETPLLLLLRKYVRDSVLESVEQPDPFERVLWLHFQHHQHGATALIVEPMGRLANILLVKPDGVILECLRRAPAGEHAQRVLLPGRVYAPPPAQKKVAPLDDGQPDYYERLGRVLEGDAPLWKALTTQLAGISPTLAREVAWRATGMADAAAASSSVLAVAQALQELWAPLRSGAWRPGVWSADGAVVGFSAYPPHAARVFDATATLSEAVERYFADPSTQQKQQKADDNHPAGPGDAYAVQRRAVASLLGKARRRIQNQLSALAADEPAPGQAVRLRTEAGWLLALHTQIEPGQRVVVVDLEEEELTIALDPGLTPIEQAQRMFKQAGKLERAAIVIPQRRDHLLNEVEFLAQLEHDLRQAVNQPEIAAVRVELEQSGLLPLQQRSRAVSSGKTPRLAAQKSAPLSFTGPDGLQILVGRNARENERVTFVLGQANDLWLHVRQAPGAHVVIRSDGRTVSDATLRMAAQLAAYHSDRRGESAVDVIVALRRNVSRLPGGRTGQVVVRREEVLRAAGRLPDNQPASQPDSI